MRRSEPPPIENDSGGRTERFIGPLRAAALAVFVAIPVLALQIPRLAGRLVWTIAIAALPLFIVLVGYHRWRRICPLAFFSQIPVLVRRPGTRRAGAWLQANAYYVSFGVFFVSLWIRLIATNGSGPAIAVFFIVIALAALLYGILYTGKTWCNYICPLSFIEKIYTEPRGLRDSPNSQCAKCTACKSACPDINEENGYWREIVSTPKRFVYFAYPGLILGFYFYYYVQAGTWGYYFGGRWTDEPGVLRTAFLAGSPGATAGFFFLPAAPRALASILTLAAAALLSFALFLSIEAIVAWRARRRDPKAEPLRARHLLLCVTAFVAFVTFYTFAGQPTLRLVPWLPEIAGVVFVMVATLFLARRFARTRESFAEETVARSLLKRWEWADLQPPKSLHDAYLIHSTLSRERTIGYTRLLEIYTEALRDSLASGLVTREEVQKLEALRGRLQIKPADHERVMAALAEEERARLTDPARQPSLEKTLQLRTYERALELHLQRVLDSDDPASDAALARLQAEHGVTPEEHRAMLERILGGAEAVTTRLTGEVAAVESASRTIAVLESEPSPAHELLADLLRRRRSHAVDHLLGGLELEAKEERRRPIRDGLTSDDPARRGAALARLCEGLPASTAALLRAAWDGSRGRETSDGLLPTLRGETESRDPYARATAIHALALRGAADPTLLGRLERDEHEIVRATCRRARSLLPDGSGRLEAGVAAGEGGSDDGRGDDTAPAGIERVLALRAAPIFTRLPVEGLARLARSSTEATLPPGEILCREGDPGEEIFVVLEGQVEITRGSGSGDERIGREGAGAVIGEMAVLDPAPRAATVRVGERGARVLRLAGASFRDALAADSSVADGVIRTLARRLRRPPA